MSLPTADWLRPEHVDFAALGKTVVVVGGVLLPGPLDDEERAAYRRFQRRGWCVFAGKTARAAACHAWRCRAARRVLVAVEHLDGGWVVSLDTNPAGRRLTGEARAVFRRLAGLAGASAVEMTAALCLARLNGFADAARLAEMVAQTFVRRKPALTAAATEEAAR